MILQAKAADQILASGVDAAPRIDRRGNLVVRNAMASAALDGRLFGVANQAAIATTAALATTWTGLCVSNPAGSNKNMILHEFGFSQTVASNGDGAIGLMTCTIATPASNVTVRNQLLGGDTSSMIADDGATIVGPILQRVFGPIGTLAVTGYGQGPQFVYKAEGSLIIPPGYTIATYTTKVIGASMIFHFVWEEVPE